MKQNIADEPRYRLEKDQKLRQMVEEVGASRRKAKSWKPFPSLLLGYGKKGQVRRPFDGSIAGFTRPTGLPF